MTITEFVEELRAENAKRKEPFWNLRWGKALRSPHGVVCPVTYLYCQKHPEDSAGNWVNDAAYGVAEKMGLSYEDAHKIIQAADGLDIEIEDDPELLALRHQIMGACGFSPDGERIPKGGVE